MLGFQPMWFWKFCWAVVSPAFLITIFLLSIFTWTEFKYAGVIPYPDWAHDIGKLLILLSAIQVPLWAFLTMITYKIRGEKVSHVLKPNSRWGPGDEFTKMTTSAERYRNYQSEKKLDHLQKHFKCASPGGVTFTKKSMPCTAQIHNIVRIALKCDTKPSRDRIPRDRENPLV